MGKTFAKIAAASMSVLLLLGIVGCNGTGIIGGDVTVVTVWTGNTHNKTFMDEMVSKWNGTVGKEKGIKIDYEVQTGDINEKITLAFTSGDAPDIFYGGDTAEQAENDKIISLEEMPGGQELVDKFKKDLTEGTHTYEGKTYSLPYSVNTGGLLYNKDMFKAAGIVDENGEAKPPKTMAEMREVAKQLTNPEKKEYGIIFTGKYGGFYGDDVAMVSARSSGHMGYDPVAGVFDYSKQAEIMKVYMGMKEDGSVFPGTETMDNDTARARFGSGGVAMKTSISYDYSVLTEQYPATIDWGVAPFPVLDENEEYKSCRYCGAYLKINRKSTEEMDKEKLMEAYRFFYSDEIMIESYKGGYDIPVNWEAIKDAELPEKMSQWRDYAALNENSFTWPPQPQTNMNGEKSLQEIWMNDIWSGTIPVSDIDNVIAEYTQKSNDGMKAYEEQHPGYRASDYMNPDWNTKIE